MDLKSTRILKMKILEEDVSQANASIYKTIIFQTS